MGATGYIIKGHNVGRGGEARKEVVVSAADGTIDVEKVETFDKVDFRIKTTYDGYETISVGSLSSGGYFKAAHIKFNEENRRYRLVCILNGGSYTPVAKDFAIYYIKFGWRTGGVNADHWYIEEYSRHGNGAYVSLEQIALNEYNVLIHTPTGYAYANIGILKEDKEPDVTIEHFNNNTTRYTPTGTIIETETPAWKNGALVDTNPEDLKIKNGLLQLADRSSTDGLGYVILRPDKTFAEQVTLSNCIYEIRYNFDLEGGAVTIPSNCVLQFVGGSISNGTLVGNNTNVSSESNNIISTSIAGTWNVAYIYAKWFGENLQSAINMSNNSVLFLEKRTYLATQKLTCPASVTIEGNGAVIKRNFQDNQLLTASNIDKVVLKDLVLDGDTKNKAVVYLSRVSNVSVSGCEIKNAGSISIAGNNDGLYCLNCDMVEIKKTHFSNCSRDGIYSVSTVNLVVEDCEIENVRAYAVANDGSNMYARKYIYSTRYTGNYLKKCGSGGLHCESVTADTTRENSPTDDTRTEYLVENNIIEDCGNSALGTSYGAITAGQYTNTLITNNIIRRWYPQKDGVYIANPAIGYAKLFNLSVKNNQFDDVQGDIIYVDGSLGITKSFEFSNNLCNFSKTAVSCYMMSTADITNNIFNISETNGVAIKLNLSNNILIKDNIFNSSFTGCASVLITQNSTVLVDKNIYNTENRIISDTETYVINRSGLYNQIGANRPTLTLNDAGFQYFDTTLGKPIYWTGAKWVDANGNDLQ